MYAISRLLFLLDIGLPDQQPKVSLWVKNTNRKQEVLPDSTASKFIFFPK
jgi:hypothetical protein